MKEIYSKEFYIISEDAIKVESLNILVSSIIKIIDGEMAEKLVIATRGGGKVCC